MNTSHFTPSGDPGFPFRLVKFLARHRVRGASRLEHFFNQRGAFEQPLLVPFSSSIKLETPVHRPDNFWDEREVMDYDGEIFAYVRTLLSRLPAPAMLVDGGADIGLYPVRLAAENPTLRIVRAFEPNPTAFFWLDRNIGRLPGDARSANMALSNFVGMGELRSPEYDSSDHARYLAPSEDGPIRVTTIDASNPPSAPTLVLKLDLEGGEVAALQGGVNTIRNADHAIVLIEANRRVASRTGIDPCHALTVLAGVRPFSFHLATDVNVTIDPAVPFYEQVPDCPVNMNLIAVSQ